MAGKTELVGVTAHYAYHHAPYFKLAIRVKTDGLESRVFSPKLYSGTTPEQSLDGVVAINHGNHDAAMMCLYASVNHHLVTVNNSSISHTLPFDVEQKTGSGVLHKVRI
jgi:hypothetical protein